MQVSELLVVVRQRGAREASRELDTLAPAASRADRGLQNLDKELQKKTKDMNAVERATRSLRTWLIAIGGSAVLGYLGREVLRATISWERMNNAMRAATGNNTVAAYNLQFLRKEVDRLGLDLETAGGAFAKITAAARGTALQGDAVREIFTAVSEASTVMGLSAEQTEGALRALEQMISKGNVQAEELRGQLGERIPGAFQAAARAMGVTTKKLNEMLKEGEVLATDLIPKLAKEWHKMFGPESERAAQSTQAQLNRFKTTLFDVYVAIGQTGVIQIFTGILGTLATVIKKNADFFVDLRNVVNDLRDSFRNWAQEWEQLPTSGKIVIGIMAALVAILVGPVAAAVAGLLAGWVAVVKYWNVVRAAANALAADITRAFGTVAEKTYNMIADMFEAVADFNNNSSLFGWNDPFVAIAGTAQVAANKYRAAAGDMKTSATDLANIFDEISDEYIEKEDARRTAQLKSTWIDEELVKQLEALGRASADAGEETEKQTKAEIAREKAMRDSLAAAQLAAEQAEAMMRMYGPSADAIHKMVREQALQEAQMQATTQGGRAYAAQVVEITKRELEAADAVKELAREQELQSEYLQAFQQYGKAYADELINLKRRELEAKDATEEAVDALEKAKTAFANLGDAIGQINSTRAVLPRGWTVELQELDRAISAAEASLVGLTPGTRAYEAAQRRLAQATAIFRQELERLTEVEKANQKAAEAAVDARVLSIQREIQALNLRGRALLQYQREQEIRAQINEVLVDLKPLQGESAEDFEKRWIAAASAIRDEMLRLFQAEDWKRIMEPAYEAWSEMGNLAKRVLGDIVLGYKVSFKDLFRDILEMWVRTLIEMAARAAAQKIVLNVAANSSGGGGGWGSLLNGVLGLFGGGGGSAVGLSGATINGASGVALNFAGGSGAAAGGAAAGGSASLSTIAAAWGWVLPVAAGLMAIYKGFIEKGSEFAQVELGGSEHARIIRTSGNVKNTIKNVTNRANAVIVAIEEITKQLDLTVEEFGRVKLGKFKGNYFVQVGEGVREFFKSAEEAMDYAAVQAIRTARLADETNAIVKRAVAHSKARTSQDFASDVQFARMISTLGDDTTTQNIRAMSEELDVWRERITALLGPSKELQEALHRISLEEARRWQALRDEITGRERTEEEERKDRLTRAHLFNAELAVRKADIALQIEETRMLIERVNQRRTVTDIELQEMERLGRGAISFARVTGASSEALEASLAALLELQAALNNIKPIEDDEVTGNNNRRGRGQGRGQQRENDRQQLRDLLDQAAWDRALETMTEYGRAIAEANKRWEEAIKLAHGDARAIQEITNARRAEVAAIRAQRIKDVYAQIRDFEGDPAFEINEVKNVANELRRSVLELGFGADRTAAAIGRITAAEQRRLRAMENDIVGSLYGYLEESKDHEQAIKDFKIAQLQAEFESYQIQLAALGAWERWAPLWQQALDAGIAAINRGAAGGGGGDDEDDREDQVPRFHGYDDAVTSVVEDIVEARRTWEEEMRQWERVGIDPLLLEFRDLTETFERLAAEARRLGMDEQRVAEVRARAFQDFWNRTMEPLRRLRESLDLSDYSTALPQERLATAQQQFNELAARARAGDFTVMAALAEAAQQLLQEGRAFHGSGSAYGAGEEGYNDLYDMVRETLDELLGGNVVPFNPQQPEFNINFEAGEIVEAQNASTQTQHNDMVELSGKVDALITAMNENTTALRAVLSRQSAAGGPG